MLSLQRLLYSVGRAGNASGDEFQFAVAMGAPPPEPVARIWDDEPSPTTGALQKIDFDHLARELPLPGDP